jgi:N-acyl-D-amino-acid deacylase
VLDLVIENGRIVDGTGNPWFLGDVGIKDGRIVEVGRVDQRGLETIDAGGRVVSPGFIDGHCHSDLMVLDDPGSETNSSKGSPQRWSGTAG